MQKKYNRLKKLKVKIIKKRGKKENPTELQKPNVDERFITTIKSVTEYTHIHIQP